MALLAELQAFLGEAGGRRIVLVGVGSSIRGDDIVGLKVLQLLEGKLPDNVLLLQTETVPESYTGVIRDYNPTHVIVVDAASFHGAPGEARIIPPRAIANTSVSTHSLPLRLFIAYVKESICPNVILLGIQGVNIDLGAELDPKVEKGAGELADMLLKLLNK